MTISSDGQSNSEVWVEIPVQVKGRTAAKLEEHRMTFIPADRSRKLAVQKLSSVDLGIPESILTAINFHAHIWKVTNKTPDAYRLVDFTGRCKKPLGRYILWYNSRDHAIAEARAHALAAYRKSASKLVPSI